LLHVGADCSEVSTGVLLFAPGVIHGRSQLPVPLSQQISILFQTLTIREIGDSSDLILELSLGRPICQH
jgi:hypothetical protein